MKSLALLLLVVIRQADLMLAFQPHPTNEPSRRNFLSIHSRIYVASKRRGSGGKEPIPVAKENSWNKMKRAFYNSVDEVTNLTSQKLNNDATRQTISDGYSEFESYIDEKGNIPARELLKDYEARASALGVAKGTQSISKKQTRTSFEAFKERLYSTVGVLQQHSSDSSGATPSEKIEHRVPYKKPLSRQLGMTSSDGLFSENLVQRQQAEQDIREAEARSRARVRNQEIRAKKEDLYKLVDAMQVAVDGFPEAMDRTEQGVKETIEALRAVPERVESFVESAKGAPASVVRATEQTKKSVEESVTNTKRIVNDVLAIPNKVTAGVKETTESIKEGMEVAKVVLRLKKPKPMPPKLPPPKPKTAKEVALNIAANVVKSAGKVTWWTTKSVASLAWNGVLIAIHDAREANTSLTNAPVSLQEAVFSKQSKPPSTPIPTPPRNIDAETDELRREVQEALRLAEEVLRKTAD
jgi:hypothetical protein